jgi:DNA-binding LytR/AlgR family response regulator
MAPSRIEYVEAQNDDVAFVAAGRRRLKNGRTAALESRLDLRASLRAHRS